MTVNDRQEPAAAVGDRSGPTEDQLELLRDKYVLWERAGRTGVPGTRDYNRRCAEALKAVLAAVSDRS